MLKLTFEVLVEYFYIYLFIYLIGKKFQLSVINWVVNISIINIPNNTYCLMGRIHFFMESNLELPDL